MEKDLSVYKFLCDQMLLGLGRWLRVAGYDTSIIEESIDDSEILEKALREKRLLLTRDRHFLTMLSGKDTVIHLNGNSLDECIKELNDKLEINWLYHPFSRCLKCNSPLREINDPEILQQVPEKIRLGTTKFWFCRACRKVYWEGSHTERMHQQLKVWQAMNRPEK